MLALNFNYSALIKVHFLCCWLFITEAIVISCCLSKENNIYEIVSKYSNLNQYVIEKKVTVEKR